MTIRSKLKGLRLVKRNKKHTACETEAIQRGWWNVVRKILPPTITEKYGWLEMTDSTFVKCIYVGVPEYSNPGYPRTISPRLIDGLLNASQVQCYIGYSFTLSPFKQKDSNKALYKAEFENVLDMESDKLTNSFGRIRNRTGFIAEDIRDDQREIHTQTVKQADTSCIITIRAKTLDDLDIAYSHVATVLRDSMVGFTPAEGHMLAAYKSAQPWGSPEEFSTIDCISPQIASMLPVKRADSRTGDTGIWFGNRKMMNPESRGKEIMVDLSKLSAEHGIIFGSTGSGKTVLELIVFGMRAHDQGYIDSNGNHKNYRIIYLTVKSDSRTQFRNIPKYYKDDGIVIDVGTGKGKVAVNPLQIIFDENMGDGTDDEWLRMYHGHKATVFAFFDAFFETGLSDNQQGYLDATLNTIYDKYGIITLYPDKIVCHPEKWNDGSNFPTIHLLRKLWKDEMDSKGLKRLYESAESLYNRTINLSNIGAYSYLNNKTTVDFSKDVIVIDLSDLKDRLQDAMSAFIIGIIGARFNADAERKTMLIIDEGVSFSRNTKRLNFITDAYMMGRSLRVTTVMCFTQPTDMSKELAATLKTNSMWAYVLGKGMDDASVEYIQKFLNLSVDDVKELNSSSVGEGILVLGNQKIPIQLKVTDQEMGILKGVDVEPKKPSADAAFMVLDSVSNLVFEQGFCLDEWIENPTLKMMDDLGYKAHLVNRVVSAGTAKAWIKSDILEVDKDTNKKKVHNQTLEHFGSVMQIAGHLLQQGFSDVIATHFEKEDISATLGNQKFAFEYEHPRSHTQQQLIDKRLALETAGKRCLFVCQGDYKPFLIKAVGEQNTYTRGAVLRKAINEIVTAHLDAEANSSEES